MMQKFFTAVLVCTSMFFSFIPNVFAATLSRGAVLGALTDTSVKVWARTDSAGSFYVEYKTSVASYPGTNSSTVYTTSDNDYTNVVTLSGLTANTTYDYRLYVDGVLATGTGSSGTFTTMKQQGSACTYRFSLTGDLAYTQAPFTLMTTVSSSYSPLFSIFPGDQIYGPATGTKAILESYYQDNWGETNLRSFLKNIPGFFIWDDHELLSPPTGQSHNWDGGKSDTYSIARAVYEEYQNSVNPTPRITGETFYTFKVCDTSFFVADSRSYRSPSSGTDSSNNDMFGSAQVEHIKSWLLNDTSTMKFLVSPSPWPDNVANGNDSYRGYNNERQEMYTFLKENNIRNLFILSGDQHNEVLYKTDLSNTNKLYEFTATPIGSDVQMTNNSLPSGGSTKVCVNTSQSKHFGIIDVDTTVSPAQVRFRAYNSSNSNLCDQTITLNDSGPSTPTVSSAANQTFNVSGSSTSMSTMTITDASTATITATNDIRIRIPTTANMTWDTSVTTATIGGGASAKVSTTVTYENSNKTAVLNVTSNFANNDAITVSGLKFTSFSGATAKTNLGVDVTNDGGADATDSKTFEIIPSSGAALYTEKNHAYNVSQSAQAIDAITVVDGSTPAITSANDIRVIIPAGTSMTWDENDTTATIGGTASAKVSTTVSYANSNKTLVLDVTSDFVAGDYITISGLSFKSFSGTSSVANIGLDTNNDGTADASDSKSVKIVGATTKVWTGLGGDKLWSNALNWSGQVVPATGDAVVFDSTNTGDVIADYVANNLASITLDATYTGTVRFTPYAVAGNLGSLSLSSSLTVNGGTLLFEGDSHVDSDTSTPSTNDGTGYIITVPSISVGASGTISANGEGFEQGVGPGHGSVLSNAGGTGGSYGGVGGYPSTYNVTPSSTYGSATSPLSLGSGGGFDESVSNTVASNGAGGAGGGALKFVVSGTMTVDGTVSANGENATTGTGGTARYGAGSGGSIWIAAGTVSGSGTISANGGTMTGTDSGSSYTGGTGGGGRVSFGSSNYSFSGSVQVNGGTVSTTYATTGSNGRAGTVSFPSAKLANFTLSNSLTLGNDISYAFGDLTIQNGGTLTFDSNPVAGTGATISATNITIDSGGTLSVNGKGYFSGDPNASGLGSGGSTTRGSGGGYGGRGGDTSSSYSGTGGGKYGSVSSPTSLGSGGVKASADGAGGGALKINLSGTLTVNGTLSADGSSAGSNGTEKGAGSGGSLWVNGGSLAGSGTIRANGGAGTTGGGVGGGGRISLGVTSNAFTGTYQVSGGARGSSSHAGYAGTISFPTDTDLTVGGSMTLGNDTTYTFHTVTINNGGTLTLDIDPTGNSNNGSGTTLTTGNLTINSGGTLTATGMGHTDTTGPSAIKGATGTSNRVGGGGHGGAGGAGASAYGSPAGGSSFDSSSDPQYPGGSCTSASTCSGARGGGAMTINVKNNFVHNGAVTANATSSTPAAGGSINMTVKNWSGTTGTMTATGGSVTTGSGGGGGGLIKIDYVNKTYAGTAPSASGGTSGGGTPGTAGSAGVVTQNAVSDTTAPTISSVTSSNITATGATITWLTDEQGSSQVEYGTTDSYGTSTTEADTSTRVLSHSVTLTGLTGSTTYHFRAKSKDDAGTPNEGVSGDYTFTTSTAPDTTAPSISNIVATPTHNSVVITWDTDEAASSYVDYGTTASYGTTTSETDTSPRVTSHSVSISGLSAATTYHFRLNSKDAATNLGQSSDQTFTTSAAPDTTAPVISNISAVVGSTSATITWDTDEASSSLVEYGLSDSYGTSTTEADTSTRVTSHSVTLSGLTQQTTYHYRVKSNDASSNLATSIGGTFTTSRLITGGAVKFVVVDLVTGTRTPTQPATSTNEKITEPTVPIKDTVNKPALVFTKSLQTNATGDEVLKLQKLLNKLGYTVAKKGPGSPGNETKKFGAATRAALIRFQNANKKYVLTPAGLSKATGILGPYTRAYLNSLPEAQTLK